jgi:dGTPase
MKNLGILQRIEETEEKLAPFACKSKLSKGRLKWEESCPLRTAFQRDRDRILHSNAFRRLKHKTQVFIAPLDDHYVTRLTHTLEVAQIGRTISRALNLNEDLTEAIALGHDLGHTPFGHFGEDLLDELFPGGFRHNEQSLRVVDLLEQHGQGLNLSWEVRDGILNHSKSYTTILGKGWANVGTLEGQVVKIADIVAYINHDTGDAIRAGIITENDLPQLVLDVLGQSPSNRINTLVQDIVGTTIENMKQADPKVKNLKLGMSQHVLEAANLLREFLFSKVYNSSLATGDTKKTKEVIISLYTYFLSHGEALPEENNLRNNAIERRVTDYIAGMTDQYAMRLAGMISNDYQS